MRKYLVITILCVCLSALLFFSPIRTSANASTNEYRRIITDDTPFFSDPEGLNLLFYLPYSYYVKILQINPILSHVECFGTGGSIILDGYVPTDMLFDDGQTVTKPYLEKKIYSASTAVLYADTMLSTPLQYVFSSRQLVYYGNAIASDGSILFFVSYNNRLGYVKESTTMPFLVDLHPNPLTFLTPEPEPDQPSKDNTTQANTTNVFSIVIIACLTLAGIIALFIAIKNTQKQTSQNYYDENEYE